MVIKPSLKRTAYHEAGHALVAYVFGWEFEELNIVPDSEGRYGAITLSRLPIFPEEFDGSLDQRRQIEEAMMIVAGGAAGERLAFMRCFKHLYGSDHTELLSYAMRLTLYKDEYNAHIEWIYHRTRHLLLQKVYRCVVEEVASALLAGRTLEPTAALGLLDPWESALRRTLTPGLTWGRL